MQVYHYNEDNYYWGESEAILDPIEGTPMLPSRSTNIAPPTDSLEVYQVYKYVEDTSTWIVFDVPKIMESLLEIENDKKTRTYIEENGKPVAKTPEDIAIEDAAYDKQEAIDNTFKTLQEDIYANLKTAFGTRIPETATADYNTYKIMISKPELFSSESLVTEFITSSFPTVDSDLDSDTKVATYASEMIASIESYSVYRMKRKKQYKDEILAIG